MKKILFIIGVLCGFVFPAFAQTNTIGLDTTSIHLFNYEALSSCDYKKPYKFGDYKSQSLDFNNFDFLTKQIPKNTFDNGQITIDANVEKESFDMPCFKPEGNFHMYVHIPDTTEHYFLRIKR
jgi:hypothetical protein